MNKFRRPINPFEPIPRPGPAPVYPFAIDEINRTLNQILVRLDAIEKRLEEIERKLSVKK